MKPDIEPAITALTALTDLADTRARTAHDEDMPLMADALHKVADNLDRARTRLIEDGGEYLEAAYEFIYSGRCMIDGYGTTAAMIRDYRA